MPENKAQIDLDDWDLFRAARKNRVDIARALISAGADIHAKASYGVTPLHIAAEKNSVDGAKLLIEHGANSEGIDLTCWMDG